MCLGLLGCGEAAAPAQSSPETTISAAKAALDGKKIIFIGNSHTYVGNVVTQTYNSNPSQEKRSNNRGFFWILCQRQGINVEVTNWTFSSHGLSSIFMNPCAVKGACYGLNHEEYLTDRYFDYVVIQPGVGTKSEENIASAIEYVVDFFRKANPDAKFVLLGNASVYGNNAQNKPYPGITAHYKVLAEQGFIIADWGGLVNDLIKEKVKPEGSAMPYFKLSFIIKDGFHPNLLSGYLGSLMLYCAITGEKAADIPTDMFQDSVMETMLDAHLEANYVAPSDSNFKTALTAESELLGLHKLVDRYLEEKPYLQ
jgi:hypothetical protein